MSLRIKEVCDICEIEREIALSLYGLITAGAKQHEFKAPVDFRKNGFAIFEIPGTNQSPLLHEQCKKSFVVVVRHYPGSKHHSQPAPYTQNRERRFTENGIKIDPADSG